MKYLIILEKTSTGYSAYSPEVPGCIATGETREETKANMAEAIEFHLEGLKSHGIPLESDSVIDYVEIAA